MTERARSDGAPLLFVGGTGRSGTHVIAKLIARHPDYRKVPGEARFHVDAGGYPDLLAGRTTRSRFLRRLRRRWWRSFEPARWTFRGLHGYVPHERLVVAAGAFETGYDDDPERACSDLFWDLFGPLAEADGKPGLVEQSCDTVAQAPTLHRVFPEARFIHAVRDGRDAAASRVSQARWLIHPRTMAQGLDWWEARLRRIDRGLRAIPHELICAVNLDELVDQKRSRAWHRLRDFVGGERDGRMAGFFERRMSGSGANRGRWRAGLSERRRTEIDRRYEDCLERLEADQVHGWRSLRRSWERERG